MEHFGGEGGDRPENGKNCVFSHPLLWYLIQVFNTIIKIAI